MAQLTKDDIVTIRVLNEKGSSNCEIARKLGVSEGAVRYHLRRAAAGSQDGRRKSFLIERLGLEEVVRQWWLDQKAALGEKRSPNKKELWDYLVGEHGYPGSYKSVRKYMRRYFPLAKRRPFRRIETPPGAQAQSDWLEDVVDVGAESGAEKLYGFVMVLSHSRKTAVVWSRSMDQLAWHHVHNEAFKRLGGIPAVNRIDNLKTGVARGAGPWGQLNESYRTYARTMGFHIDPHEGGEPQQKGKAERRVGAVKGLDFRGQRFDGVEHLQSWTDERLEADALRRICPATGKTVAQTWAEERKLLRPLPAFLPEPFDLVKERGVSKDSTVRFEGRTYSVPFRYLGDKMEIRGCSGFVQIADRATGEIVQQYPRGSEAILQIDQACYEGEATERVAAPRPLGKMSRKLLELAAEPVQRRAIDFYAELAEVAR